MPRPKGSKNKSEAEKKPKGRMTAYSFFVQTCRAEHQRQHPDEIVEFFEFGKKCSERWKTMSEKEKKKFQQMADVDKKRFDVEMSTYNARQVILNKSKVKKGKKKDPNAPRRSLSAFFWFSKDVRSKVREANPNFNLGEVAREIARRWNEASPEIRAKYDQLAENDRDRYSKEKKMYQEKLNDEKAGIITEPTEEQEMSDSEVPAECDDEDLDDDDELE